MSTLGHQYDNSTVSNAFGFLRLPMNFMPYESDADWVITGVPFDMATSGRAGGRHGPAAIRQVSTNLAREHNRFPWNFDMRERLNVVDCGDLVYAFGDAREMSEAAGSRRSCWRPANVCSPLAATTSLPCRCCAPMPSTLVKWRWCTSMLTPIPTPTAASSTTAPCSIPRRTKGLSIRTTPYRSIRTEFDKDNGFTVLDAGG